MKLPAINGIIDRRILANYHIDPKVLAEVLPSPFRPKLINGYGIGGICLIRLKDVKPDCMPLPFGIRSENAAHRFAVEWEENGQFKEGVYVPRRDTDSRLNAMTGGTIFPGIHHHAKFTVKETENDFSVSIHSDDGDTHISVSGTITDQMPSTSVFSSLEEASLFFENGSLGYSDTNKPGVYDGLELACKNWQVEILDVEAVSSSYFEDTSRFPAGSVEFDCALLMRNIKHQWLGRKDLCC